MSQDIAAMQLEAKKQLAQKAELLSMQRLEAKNSAYKRRASSLHSNFRMMYS